MARSKKTKTKLEPVEPAAPTAPFIQSKGRRVVARHSFKTYARTRPKNAWARAIAPNDRLTIQEWDAWVKKQLQSKA